jgi:hypothetical protein
MGAIRTIFCNYGIMHKKNLRVGKEEYSVVFSYIYIILGPDIEGESVQTTR